MRNKLRERERRRDRERRKDREVNEGRECKVKREIDINRRDGQQHKISHASFYTYLYLPEKCQTVACVRVKSAQLLKGPGRSIALRKTKRGRERQSEREKERGIYIYR